MTKVALITGASRGIGRAAALALAQDGYCVIANYHKNEQAAAELCAEIAARGGRALPICADVADEVRVCAMFRQAEQTFGAPQVLVNNAGVAHFGLLQDMSADEWRRLMAVDLDGAFYCIKAALPAMLAAKNGSIINIASIWGEEGASCEAAYSAAKGGLIALTKALAKELGPGGVRVNCVSPGVIATDMNARLSKAELQELAEATPLGRCGLPQEVAEAVRFLASDKSAFITGQIIGVNGGFS